MKTVRLSHLLTHPADYDLARIFKSAETMPVLICLKAVLARIFPQETGLGLMYLIINDLYRFLARIFSKGELRRNRAPILRSRNANRIQGLLFSFTTPKFLNIKTITNNLIFFLARSFFRIQGLGRIQNAGVQVYCEALNIGRKRRSREKKPLKITNPIQTHSKPNYFAKNKAFSRHPPFPGQKSIVPSSCFY